MKISRSFETPAISYALSKFALPAVADAFRAARDGAQVILASTAVLPRPDFRGPGYPGSEGASAGLEVGLADPRWSPDLRFAGGSP